MARSATNRIGAQAKPGSTGSLSLAELQASLLGAATTGRVAADPALMRSIRAARHVPACERIEAYRVNIRAAHLRALDRAYPVTREVLGPRYWQALLEHELPVYASSSPNLHRYGDFLPRLLGDARRGRDELAEFPYLGELARLEWAVHCAGFASDDRRFDWQRFAALTDEAQSRARMIPSSALAILQLRHPVDDIWRSHTGGAACDGRVEGRVACCVHRSGRFGVTVSRLGKDDHALLEQLSSVRIGKLMNFSDKTASAGTAQQIFDWIERGWIVGFEVGCEFD